MKCIVLLQGFKKTKKIVDLCWYVGYCWESCLNILGCCTDFCLCGGSKRRLTHGCETSACFSPSVPMPARENQLQTFRSGDSGYDMWILNAYSKNELRWISGGKWHFEELTTQDSTAFEGPRFSVALCIFCGCCDPRCNEVDQSLWSWASVWFAVFWSCDLFDNKNATEAMPMGCHQKRPDPRGFGKLKGFEGIGGIWRDSVLTNAKLHIHHLTGHLLTPWSTTRRNRATLTRAYSQGFAREMHQKHKEQWKKSSLAAWSLVFLACQTIQTGSTWIFWRAAWGLSIGFQQ